MRDAARRIGLPNFTRLLLVRCVARFLSASVSSQFRLRSSPPDDCRSESSRTPLSNLCAAPHTTSETVPCREVTAALLRFRWPAYNSAAIVLRPERLEKPLAHWTPSAGP